MAGLDWSRAEVIDFINDYRGFSALWDANHPGRKDSFARNSAYEQLMTKLIARHPEITMQSIKAKINTLRTQFRKEFKQIKIAENIGGAYLPKLWCFNALEFLWDSYEAEGVLDNEEPRSFMMEDEPTFVPRDVEIKSSPNSAHSGVLVESPGACRSQPIPGADEFTASLTPQHQRLLSLGNNGSLYPSDRLMEAPSYPRGSEFVGAGPGVATSSGATAGMPVFPSLGDQNIGLSHSAPSISSDAPMPVDVQSSVVFSQGPVTIPNSSISASEPANHGGSPHPTANNSTSWPNDSERLHNGEIQQDPGMGHPMATDPGISLSEHVPLSIMPSRRMPMRRIRGNTRFAGLAQPATISRRRLNQSYWPSIRGRGRRVAHGDHPAIDLQRHVANGPIFPAAQNLTALNDLSTNLSHSPRKTVAGAEGALRTPGGNIVSGGNGDCAGLASVAMSTLVSALSSAHNGLTEAAKRDEDEFNRFGAVVADSLRKIDSRQTVIAKKLIGEIIFNGELGLLDFNSCVDCKKPE